MLPKIGPFIRNIKTFLNRSGVEGYCINATLLMGGERGLHYTGREFIGMNVVSVQFTSATETNIKYLENGEEFLQGKF